jgi:hypothetical protein
MYGHGQYSAETHHKVNTACDWAAAAGGAQPSAACKAMLDEMSAEIGGYNVYNIYDQCKVRTTPSRPRSWANFSLL